MKRAILILAVISTVQFTFSQVNAKLMRYMDVSDDQITFVYGGDIWVMSKEGGTAMQVTHSPGEESWPRFSPDGSFIAFTASYNGNQDVYVMPSDGGLPTRVTYQSLRDRLVDWHPDGEHLLIASGRESGRQSTSKFFMVSKDGGMPVKLSIPYGELASYSPDGNYLAYITKITENYPFKRYRGGLSSDILIYDLLQNKAENITRSHAIDGKPAWVGDEIFFLSDQGEHMRLNIWVYNTKDKNSSQLTYLKDFDISFLSASSSELVFEAGGELYLMNATTKSYEPVKVNVISDLSLEMPRKVNVGNSIQNFSASPEGKRIVFEARGELFNVPAKEGYVLNLTQSSGAFDMFPSWSPDGENIAYWSDRSGEYELYLQDSELKDEALQMTTRGKGFGYQVYWSPDSKKIAYIDETNDISILDVESREVIVAGNYRWNYGHGGRDDYPITWSPDSKWLAFTEGLDNTHNAIILYNEEQQEAHQLSSGFYDDFGPVFSEDGNYLYFLTNRNMQATYSDMGDGTWVYTNATQVAAVALLAETPSLLQPKNDELTKSDEDEKEGEVEEGEKEKDKTPAVDVKVDFDGLESRVTMLPMKAGNIGWLASFKGKLVYLRQPNTGSESKSSSLIYWDLEKREEKNIISDVGQVKLTADGKMMIVNCLLL